MPRNHCLAHLEHREGCEKCRDEAMMTFQGHLIAAFGVAAILLFVLAAFV